MKVASWPSHETADSRKCCLLLSLISLKFQVGMLGVEASRIPRLEGAVGDLTSPFLWQEALAGVPPAGSTLSTSSCFRPRSPSGPPPPPCWAAQVSGRHPPLLPQCLAARSRLSCAITVLWLALANTFPLLRGGLLGIRDHISFMFVP